MTTKAFIENSSRHWLKIQNDGTTLPNVYNVDKNLVPNKLQARVAELLLTIIRYI